MTLHPSLSEACLASSAQALSIGEDADSDESAVSRLLEVEQLGPDLWMLIKSFISLMMIRPF
jgi:hypothetical protein